MTQNKGAKLFYGYIVVIVAFAVMIVTVGGFNSFGVYFAPVLKEFGWTRAVTSGALSVAMIVNAILAAFVGRLNDRLGPRLLLMVSGVFFGLGFVLMSLVQTVWQLYLLYGIVGIGISGTVVPLQSTVARWFVKRRSIMTGVILSGIGAGVLVMPLLAGWLIAAYSWRVSFVTLGIIGLVVYFVAARFIKRDPRSIGLLAYGESEAGRMSAEITGLSVKQAIRSSQLWLLVAIMVAVGIADYSILVHIVIHATGIGISAASAAGILSLIGAFNIVGRMVGGSTADRLGSRQAFTVALCVMLAALVWVQFAKDLWTLLVFGAVFGFAYGAAYVPASPMVAEFFGLRSHGALFGIAQTGFLVGGTIGPVVVGYTYDVTDSYRLGFIILAAVAAAGLVCAWLIRPLSVKKTAH
ncbi:MAG: MFS transporter [Chloroflexi bacterium]|nr:MFS transporter [Chloroflexota bacterium]